MSKIKIEEIKRIKHFVSQVFVSFGISMLGASFVISIFSFLYWNLILLGLVFIILGAFIEFLKPKIPNEKLFKKMTNLANLSFNLIMIGIMFITLLPQITSAINIYGFLVILLIFFLYKILFD
jgi:hypothetical protein